MTRLKECECQKVGRHRADFFNSVNAFPQGEEVEYIDQMYDRFSDFVDWIHPEIKKFINNDFKGETLNFFEECQNTTAGFRE